MAAGTVGSKVGLPLKFRMPSARIERAEFPVQRNKTL
jgi:hypothetical protein